MITVNGEAKGLDGFEDASLLRFLREGLGLKGPSPVAAKVSAGRTRFWSTAALSAGA